MEKSNVIQLLTTTYTADAIGQRVPTETARQVFCDVQSVTRSEWLDAGNRGFKPEYRVTMFAPDYAGEQVVVFEGVRYTIYRTYRRQDDDIELYLERRAGS